MKFFLCLPTLLFPFWLSAENISIGIDESLLTDQSAQHGAVWKITEAESRGPVLNLYKSGTPPLQPVRRPANILLLPLAAQTAFTLDLEAKSPVIQTKGADLILVFGYQNDTHYYYAHISNDADNKVHHVVMKVEGDKQTRTAIQNEKAPRPTLNGGWQTIRLVRGADGKIEVYVDDMDTPTLTANDRTWPHGKIGIGSFNDPVMFDHIRISTE